jgi:sugar phosphate isomerase/epimerase
MIQTVNFPISNYCIEPYGSWENLKKKIHALGLDGIEAINCPNEAVPDFPDDLVAGYHMMFYVDWLDYWRQDEEKLMRKFGSWEMVEKIYHGSTPEDLMRQFKDDQARALGFHTPYMVFHVSDVSMEENYTYQWEHTDIEVLDGAIEFINALLKDIPPTFDFLVENQWWPGFKFTEPEKTEYLLSHIDYPRVGIMLDTGHLMNANTKLCTQADGIAWIMKNITAHGELSRRIYGLHFHQSVSGAYVRKHTGFLPPEFTDDYFHNFSIGYPHVQRIDRHLPWTDPNCIRILDAVQPKYLTHELSYGPNRPQLGAVKRQLGTIRKGYAKK